MPAVFRKRPVEVQAVQWTGGNAEELMDFAGSAFDAFEPGWRCGDDPEATAQVFDGLHSTWVLVYTGDWIIKGVRREFYPCRNDVFAETYETVDQ
jgi:hypothetical protein